MGKKSKQLQLTSPKDVSGSTSPNKGGNLALKTNGFSVGDDSSRGKHQKGEKQKKHKSSHGDLPNEKSKKKQEKEVKKEPKLHKSQITKDEAGSVNFTCISSDEDEPLCNLSKSKSGNESTPQTKNSLGAESSQVPKPSK